MKHRRLIIGGTLAIGVALLVAWVMHNTYWEEVVIASPLKGPAATDPHYAAKALARQLGAEVSAAAIFESPPADGVIHLSGWNWTMGEARRLRLQRWVEAGGRLVLDDTVYFLGEEFTAWSGVSMESLQLSEQERNRRARLPYQPCRQLRREGERVLAGERERHAYQVCGADYDAVLASKRPAPWTLRDDDGIRALRVPVGQGSVALILARPFRWRSLLEADHAELFAAMTQLRDRDNLLFLTEDQHPSLLSLGWRYGWPALVPALLALALALWRRGTRFGPLMPAPLPLRRSLVEQIRGTGRFVLRNGDGAILHAASVRALEDLARRNLPGFEAASGSERVRALTAATGIATDRIWAVLELPARASRRTIIAAIVQLESIRRRIQTQATRQKHGS